ncbi:helix-turn-helix domain-containing protein [Pseudoflavonifractor sp. BIOML-A6]|nr:helix-turn-helix domain-containing protein [Pseudoflavonifractor sp. BIOML-A16]MTR06496.1 helix-turn-helix domain-containing protein [Pseudoflavonifractor sp. BIOML-A15]MTR13911.1 helix-turn-helix domain-containing protein [Pseudoflavonifractor sp. BIOML-A17]MTR21894.1 helix-turn-helix domain-containing protein [Pseudoflavonifractor sp. BIOML-A19]MTR31877.1 helix-turn-helix domain-containing protein [Pseudoflavonifractor sp. BIOML-A14]MTR36471.1 helix-turn-helix domain-containing protein [P
MLSVETGRFYSITDLEVIQLNPSEKDSQRFQLAARRVRRRREAIGVTAAELAGRAGVPAGRVEALEAGKPGALRMDELFDLCAALGIRPRELFEP